MVEKYTLPYFRRDPLLQDVDRIYKSGLKQGITLFAQRRFGKTSFVRHELLPFAQQTLAWRTLYVDLWAKREAPDLALVEALEIYARIYQSRWKRLRLKELHAKGDIHIASLESTFTGEPKSDPETPAARVAAALTAAVGKQPTLLVIDEIQALAGTRNIHFVAALRTAFQALDGQLHVFYTGSSRAGLNRMFRLQRAPLFESTHSVTLPELDDRFVDDRLRFLSERSAARVNRAALISAFDTLGRTPEYFNELVLMLMLANDGDVAGALQRWQAVRAEAFDAETLKDLRPLDGAVLKMLASPKAPSPYSLEAESRLSADPKVDHVNSSRIQGSLRKLVARGLIAPTGATGGYEIEDRALLLYLRSLL